MVQDVRCTIPIIAGQYNSLQANTAIGFWGSMQSSSRRRFLTLCAGVSCALAAPGVLARSAPPTDRSLSLYNLHTGESLRTTYFAEGVYQTSELAAINQLLRDHRNGQVHEIDKPLLELLSQLNLKLGSRQAFHVISGYRSPATNAMLHERSGGVASRSLHLDGKAIDIRLPDRDLREVQRAARAMQAGGVGYYERSNFVHVDVGRVRYW